MKFLVFITLLVSGWYVLRWLQRFEINRRLREQRQGGQGRDGQRTAAPRQQMRATDTMICSRCGAYVPSDFPTACDRADCPFPGVG
jgi:hypothetical protein